MDQQGDSNPYRLVIILLEKAAKDVWKSLDKKKALKYNNLRANFVNFSGEGGIRTHGTVLPVRRFSKPFLSATQAPLRPALST